MKKSNCGCFFFFSSRRRHTRWNCDWSSDVCSSDLAVPRHVAQIDEMEAPPQMSFNNSGVAGGVGDGSRDGVWRSLGDPVNRPAPLPVPAPAPTVRAFRRSSLLEGNLVRRVQPLYPPLARSARIQG